MKPALRCGTCRDRKVLCDRTVPVCKRCVKACRKCLGYGIRLSWPEKDTRRSITFDPSQQGSPALTGVSELRWINTSFWDVEEYYRFVALIPAHSVDIPQYIFPVAMGELDGQERRSFEWFVHRAATKVPGIFPSAFWHTLVPQASLSERVVLHAVLALASAHETAMRVVPVADRITADPAGQDEFTIRQYNKAINHLLPLLSDTDTASVRVALIACMLFTCIDFLQKRYKTGYAHLQTGRKVLCQIRARQNISADGTALSAQSSDVADGWLFDAFARLDLQAALLNKTNSQLFNDNNEICPAVPLVFQSIEQARRSLDMLLRRSYNLRHDYRECSGQTTSIFDEQFSLTLLQLRAELSSWLLTYEFSKVILEQDMSARDAIGYQLLHIYHIMANVLAGTAANHVDESRVNNYTTHFISIITRTKDLLEASKPVTFDDITSKQCSQKFSFTMDMGIIPPLYFVAVHCRVPNVRRQAIELLENASYQEGVWDGALAAKVATEIMRIEENGVMGHKEPTEDGAEHCTSFSGPCIPELFNISVELPDVASGKLKLTGRRRCAHGYWSWETFSRHYDLRHNVWSG